MEISTNDVATAIWGSNWRMPTKYELGGLLDLLNGSNPSGTGLYNGLVWTFCDGSTTQYVPGCTLRGFKISGKVGTPYESNSIFLPQAGYFLTKKVENFLNLMNVVIIGVEHWMETQLGVSVLEMGPHVPAVVANVAILFALYA